MIILWPYLLPVAYVIASAFGLYRFARWQGDWTITQRIAIVYLAGDIAGASTLIQDYVTLQAVAIAVVVCAEQGKWLYVNRARPNETPL